MRKRTRRVLRLPGGEFPKAQHRDHRANQESAKNWQAVSVNSVPSVFSAASKPPRNTQDSRGAVESQGRKHETWWREQRGPLSSATHPSSKALLRLKRYDDEHPQCRSMESAGRAVPVERHLVRRRIVLDWARVGGRHVETAESLLPLRPHIVGIHYPYLCVAYTRRPQSIELHRPVSGCERKKEGSTLPNTLHFGHGLDVLQLRPVLNGGKTIW